jgi:phage terminase large subunit-like protein
MLGLPPMPWQSLVADAALDVDPDTGLRAYREVALTVPRQSGKTTLIFGAAVHRAQGFGRKQRIINAARTRNHARQKWEEEHLETLKASPLNPLTLRPPLSNGSEAIR